MQVAVPNCTIDAVEWVVLHGKRPRVLGRNARLGEHGDTSGTGFVRITAAGVSGFGASRAEREWAAAVVGRPIDTMIDGQGWVRPEFRAIEFPLLDWLGKAVGEPVYRLVARGEVPSRLEVPCYDTSLYMDDLHLPDDREAVALLQSEARQGWERGHRAFKLKVGRGAMHMPLEAGMARDIAVVLGVREALGPAATIMIDANNGLNLNLTKTLLRETAAARVYWVEEPFHEDAVLFAALKRWLDEQEIATLIADGEGQAHPELVRWAREGVVDVLNYDIRRPGFTWWRDRAEELAGTAVRIAPHNFGTPYGNYVSCHLATAVERYAFTEWDEGTMEGLDASAYGLVEGRVQVPRAPGFGLHLDEGYFERRVREAGWRVTV